MSATENSSPSFADLVRDLRDESTTLLRQEVALAKAEMGEKVAKVGRNIAYAIIGGAIAHLALIFLLLAASGAIDFGIEQTSWAPHGQWIAPMIVGVIVGVLGAVLIAKAASALSSMSMTPDKTIASIKEDKQWVQNKVA